MGSRIRVLTSCLSVHGGYRRTKVPIFTNTCLPGDWGDPVPGVKIPYTLTLSLVRLVSTGFTDILNPR